MVFLPVHHPSLGDCVVTDATEPTEHKEPSRERGCQGKANLGRKYAQQADRLASKHGKVYGVYQCPHCLGFHMTTKIQNAHLYGGLLYITGNGG